MEAPVGTRCHWALQNGPRGSGWDPGSMPWFCHLSTSQSWAKDSFMPSFSYKLERTHQSYFIVKMKLDNLWQVASTVWSRLVPHKCELLILLWLRDRSQYHGARLPGIKSCLHPFIAMCPWVSYFTSLGLICLICKMDIRSDCCEE